MRYALFPGCLAQTEQYGYELSARETLPKLGVELTDLEESSCCGFPSFSVSSPLRWRYLSARNIALADRLGLGVLTLCSSCHLSLSEAKKELRKSEELATTIKNALAIEGLNYTGESKVLHLLELLHNEVGTKNIEKKVVRPLGGLKLAAHPGCLAFRPKGKGRPEYRRDPMKLERLIEALGADAVDYPEKRECCGAYPYDSHPLAAMRIAGSKLEAVQGRGIDGIVTTCPHCFRILDNKQQEIRKAMGGKLQGVPVVHYTQLLGLALGSEPEKLGLSFNMSPVNTLLDKVVW